MAMSLGALHGAYIALVLLIIGFMVLKKDTGMLCIVGIFVIGLIATTSVPQAIGGVFNSFVLAINELSGTILIISVITGLCGLLEMSGVSELMVAPVTRFIKTPASAYWIIGMVMFVVSSFFWPSPAVALIGAVFLPVAVEAKLPVMGAAVAMNLFGHGIALSGDLIIQGAPKIVAEGAGIETAELVAASIPLVIIMGVVTTVAAFIFLQRDMKKGVYDGITRINDDISRKNTEIELSPGIRRLFAIVTPLVFAADLAVMSALKLQGGDASALIGGTALLLLIALAITVFKGKSLEIVTERIVEGFKFGFTVFGPVIPIAAFFYLGDSALVSIFGDVLPEGSAGLVNDIGVALSNVMPVNGIFSALTVSGLGAITGLDGSGFSGITLVGSVSRLFATALGKGTATLSALGQISAIWVGGGTIIPWAVIPVAAICGINPIELAAKNIKPVFIGLVVTTVAAMFLL